MRLFYGHVKLKCQRNRLIMNILWQVIWLTMQMGAGLSKLTSRSFALPFNSSSRSRILEKICAFSIVRSEMRLASISAWIESFFVWSASCCRRSSIALLLRCASPRSWSVFCKAWLSLQTGCWNLESADFCLSVVSGFLSSTSLWYSVAAEWSVATRSASRVSKVVDSLI